MHAPAQLAHELSILPPVPYHRVLYRAVPLSNLLRPHGGPTTVLIRDRGLIDPTTSFRPLFDLGPTLSARRYSPPGTIPPPPGTPPGGGGPVKPIPALYAAEDPDTAYIEANFQAWMTAAISPVGVSLPLTSTLHIRVDRPPLMILDVTQPATWVALGTNYGELVADWLSVNGGSQWAPTQLLGYLAFHSGRFHGIRFHSARRPSGICTVLFTQTPPAHGLPQQCCVSMHDIGTGLRDQHPRIVVGGLPAAAPSPARPGPPKLEP